MRQTSYDKLVARTAIQNAYEASKGDKGPEALVRFAFTVEKHLHDAGFEIVRKPEPASGPGILGAKEIPWPEGGLSEDETGYSKALAMLRGSRIPGVAQVAEALGEASPNGPEGNIWKVLDQRYATTRLGRGLFTEESIRRDVMEVRDGMLRVRPGSPIALLFADLDTLMQRGGKPMKLEPHAGAVRDLIEAHRLIADATDILGHDAVDEILNNLADPVRGEAA